MRRLLVSIIIAVSSIYGICAIDTSFFLELEKFAPITLMFYDPDAFSGTPSDTNLPAPIEAVSFSARYGDESDAGPIGVYWSMGTTLQEIADSSYVTISMYFYSENLQSADNGYMLISDHDSARGLNYSVSDLVVSGNPSSSGIPVSNPMISLALASRGIQLDRKSIVETGGNLNGWATFEIRMPGFTEFGETPPPLGRYTGRIAVVVTTE